MHQQEIVMSFTDIIQLSSDGYLGREGELSDTRYYSKIGNSEYIVFGNRLKYIKYFVHYYFSVANLLKDSHLINKLSNMTFPVSELVTFPKLANIGTTVAEAVEAAMQLENVEVRTDIKNEPKIYCKAWNDYLCSLQHNRLPYFSNCYMNYNLPSSGVAGHGTNEYLTQSGSRAIGEQPYLFYSPNRISNSLYNSSMPPAIHPLLSYDMHMPGYAPVTGRQTQLQGPYVPNVPGLPRMAITFFGYGMIPGVSHVHNSQEHNANSLATGGGQSETMNVLPPTLPLNQNSTT